MGAHLHAVQDLRAQYEALATTVADVAGLFDSDELVEDMEQALFGALDNELPSELDGLSSSTTVNGVCDVEVSITQIHRGGLRIRGSASIDVGLEWGGGERRDGLEASNSFPLDFDVDVDRSREIVTAVHRLEVDVSSFYE